MDTADLRHRLMAILAADVVGYSRLMSADERATIIALDTARDLFRRCVEGHSGRVVDTAGDSVLAVFDTAAGAVETALAIQPKLAAANVGSAKDRQMRFRIGIHLGDVIEKADGTVYGDGVNIAARLEGLAEPGGIVVSDSIRNAVKGKLGAMFRDLGERTVKNIADPVRTYAVAPGAETTTLAAATGIDVLAPVAGFGGRPALAVLPFANLSGDPEQEYFADGLADDILTRLALWRWFPVIARNSSFSYKGRSVDVKVVGRELGARYILEGSVRKAGNRMRVTGQLIDAETGHHLWAERYDRVLEDLFAVQDELTEGIVGALEPAIGRAETERSRRKPPSSLDAWDAFQRGYWHAHRMTREDFAIAEPLYRRAADLDPGLAQPHMGLAAIRLYQGIFLWTESPTETFAEGLASAHAALAADPLDSHSHMILGALLAITGKHDEALAVCHKAIELNPSSALAYSALWTAHLYRGEPELGIRAVEAAIRLSPNDMAMHIWLGSLAALHYGARNYAKAAQVARLAVQRQPQYPLGWRALANASGQLGELEEARLALARYLELSPGFVNEQAARASTGFRDEAVFQHYLEGLRKAGWTG